MEISKLFNSKKMVLSVEIFPPKSAEGLDTVYDTVKSLAVLKPDFISVTYGAGGSAKNNITADITSYIQDKHGIPSLSHLTCSGLTKNDLNNIIADFKSKNIKNILALRGDEKGGGGYKYASELICALKGSNFDIAGACYPEGHIESESLDKDLDYLKLKQDCGAKYFISQLFFENEVFDKFLSLARAKGVTVPISAGIMPLLSKSQIDKMIYLCGASLPSPIIKLINKYGQIGDDLIKAGIDYALNQMLNLKNNNVDGIHIYTMNKPFIAHHLMQGIR